MTQCWLHSGIRYNGYYMFDAIVHQIYYCTRLTLIFELGGITNLDILTSSTHNRCI